MQKIWKVYSKEQIWKIHRDNIWKKGRSSGNFIRKNRNRKAKINRENKENTNLGRKNKLDNRRQKKETQKRQSVWKIGENFYIPFKRPGIENCIVNMKRNQFQGRVIKYITQGNKS